MSAYNIFLMSRFQFNMISFRVKTDQFKEKFERKYSFFANWAKYRRKRRQYRRYGKVSIRFIKEKEEIHVVRLPKVNTDLISEDIIQANLPDTKRFDYIIIWGHGMKYQAQILEMIKNHPCFRIAKIVKHKPKTIKSLIKAVYSYDYAPFRHLKGKTKYLLATPKEAMFIFIENLDPQEDYFGKGVYRHIESTTLKKFKGEVRDKFADVINGTKSDEHMIHASDNEAQTHFILQYLGFDGILELKESGLAKAMNNNKEITLRTVDINTLYGKIVEHRKADHKKKEKYYINIDQSPHYKFLSGDKKPYIEYTTKLIGTALQDDHCPEKFNKLLKSFNYLNGPYRNDYIQVKEDRQGKYRVLAGFHRVTILKYQNHEKIKVAVIK